MATLNSVGAVLTTSAADIYTAPSGGARITMIQIANVDGAQAVDVTVQWTDASASNAVRRLAYLVSVNARDSISVEAGGLLLAAGDKIQALASANSDAEITVSAVES